MIGQDDTFLRIYINIQVVKYIVTNLTLVMAAYTLGVLFRFLVPYILKYFAEGMRLPVDWRYVLSSLLAFLVPLLLEAANQVFALEVSVFDEFVAMSTLAGLWAAFLSAIALNEILNNMVKGVEIKRA